MKSINMGKKIQEVFLNSWPASDYYFLHGWILRFNEGITDRSNAVIPLSYTGNDVKVDIGLVEKFYEKMNINPSFMIYDYHEPPDLRQALISRGYHIVSPTNVMMASIDSLKTFSINEHYDYYLNNQRTEEFSNFLARFTHWSESDQRKITFINQKIKIAHKIYLTVKSKGKMIASMMGVLVEQKFLYLADILVHPEFRRRKIASTMIYRLLNDWGIKIGAEIIWLQVEKNNRIACSMYENLGMDYVFSYSYLKKFKNK